MPSAHPSRRQILAQGWSHPAADRDNGHARLRQLYETGAALTKLESIERTMPEVLALVCETIPLRTAILLLDDPDGLVGTRAFLWHAEAVSAVGLRAATAHAHRTHAYLTGVPHSHCDEAEPGPLPPSRAAKSPEGGRQRFVVLPLVVGHRRIFGALQVEGVDRLDEDDLRFVNAVANHLAIALDRLAIVQRRQAEAEARRSAAETDTATAMRAERAQRCLSRISAQLAASLDEQATRAVVLRAAVPLLGDMAILDVIADDGRSRQIDVVFEDPGQAHLVDRIRAALPAASPSDSDGAQLLGELADGCVVHDPSFTRLLVEIGAETAMILPMVARGHRLGALTLVATSARRFDREDLALAEEVAGRAALAIDNARLYEQARRATRTREDLLAIVSHDLKNPLGNILMGLAVLSRVVASRDAKEARRIATIQRSAETMERIITDLLDLASLDAGGLAVTKRPELVAALLRAASEPYEGGAAGKRISLECEAVAEALVVSCDRGRILQVLGNLIGNAVKFTTEGGAVVVRAELRGAEIRFSVTDTGPGIAADDMPHLFDRYWQARRTAHLGTGLGLSIAKGLVEAHGGRIWVDSALGCGTAFFFTIPGVDGR